MHEDFLFGGQHTVVHLATELESLEDLDDVHLLVEPSHSVFIQLLKLSKLPAPDSVQVLVRATSSKTSGQEVVDCLQEGIALSNYLVKGSPVD